MEALSRKYQKTPAQLFFSYLISLGILPLTGTTSSAHMAEDLEAVSFQPEDSDARDIS
eukprot:gene2144-2563_t